MAEAVVQTVQETDCFTFMSGRKNSAFFSADIVPWQFCREDRSDVRWLEDQDGVSEDTHTHTHNSRHVHIIMVNSKLT